MTLDSRELELYEKEQELKDCFNTQISKSDYLETHYEVSVWVENNEDDADIVIDAVSENGMGGKWVLAQILTDEFQSKYKDTIWGEELDWLDTLYSFLNSKKYQ